MSYRPKDGPGYAYCPSNATRLSLLEGCGLPGTFEGRSGLSIARCPFFDPDIRAEYYSSEKRFLIECKH